jgi:putative transposase
VGQLLRLILIGTMRGHEDRAELSHVPLRKRVMQGFRSPGGLQRFTRVFSAVQNFFVPPNSRRSALALHLHRLTAMAEWKSTANLAG